MFIEHDLQNNTFCNVFMPFYSRRTYVVYGTTVNMWTTQNFVRRMGDHKVLTFNQRDSNIDIKVEIDKMFGQLLKEGTAVGI